MFTPDGPENSDMLFVAEAPGKVEGAKGAHLSGKDRGGI